MFSSNDTPPEEFKLANDLGAIINLDDITHIECVEKVLGYIPKTISCRYNPGGLFKISNDIMDNPGDAKYGMTTEQMFEAYKILKEKGAENFGMHAFLASNTVTNEYYPMLAKVLFELAVKLKEETGAHITFINLSGGIGIPYRPEQEPNDIMAIGEGVRKVYEEVLVPAGMGDVAIYTELGRFMLAPYGCLVTKAIHEKHTHKEYIGVDACAVNLMRPAMYGAYHHITVAGKEDAPCDHKYDVTGSLCENNDKFAIDRMLPKIDMGDLLVIHDTGAHGFAMGYNANGSDIFQYSGQMAHGHASECGTSVMLYLYPELVDMDELSRVEPIPAGDFPDFIGFGRFTDRTPNGTIGDATVATREKGEKIVTRCVDRIAAYMEQNFR